jgi:beta-glucosidase
VTRVDSNVDLTESNLPAEVKDKGPVAIQWSGYLTPDQTGEYILGIAADGIGIVTVDGVQVAQEFAMSGPDSKLGRIHFEAGHKVKINVTYAQMGGNKASAQLIWSKYDTAPSAEALAAAKDADVVVAVVGITSQLEGEEMKVSEEGFLGGDRTSLDLPKPEESLVEALAATGKPLVVVLMNGSALGVNWANQHANAILEAWYSGEEGGSAIAETLSGKNNPAGRLPLTFYTGVSQLPHFEDYSMQGRTYRYFKGEPLYPFGYGLSYTTFGYSDLKLPTAPIAAGSPLTADVTVTNKGSKAGDEVAQLYLTFPDVKGAPIRALRAFQRVHLDAGASQTVHFELKPRDLNMVTEDGDPIIAAGKYTVSVGGGQPKTTAPTVSGDFTVEGTMKLSE